ncbi:serine protease [Flavobacterium sp. FZUC8N2.13]|uniref:Serine protease n=1 Tax=Flavobacterium zubiriense TaxID=3138075 RepID=A0ABV4T920_9FLAO
MKKIILLLVIVGFYKSYSQSSYATIKIYRPKALCIGCKVSILINDTYICDLKNGGYLEFNAFITENSKVTVTDGSSYTSSLQIALKKGQTYNYEAKAKFPRNLGFELVQAKTPIDKDKIKKEDYFGASDVGVGIKENIKPNHPKTDWTKDKLLEYWNKNGMSDIEGIYEKLNGILKYELAIVKNDNVYSIIYLSGAEGTSWKTGELKATLQKTASFGLFKSKWFMLDKSENKDMIVSVKQSTMSLISETVDVKNDIYLKTFPAYDENVKTGESENWKSSGTGFFIAKNGYITTNFHVVEDANFIEIEYLKKPYKAKVIVSDKHNDLAILKIEDNSFIPLTTLNYNFKTEISDVGTSVFALGFPLTEIMGKEIKYTDGKISAKSGYKGDISSYQISVPIQPGNSGGPLFDENGSLLGVTSSGINKTIADNANYAIKIKYLNLLIDETEGKIELPNSALIKAKPLTEKIKILSDYVVFIKVK